MRDWYQRQFRRTALGTVLATAHFVVVALLVSVISISPGVDWEWWPFVPFFLDLPVSLLVGPLCSAGTSLLIWLLPASLVHMISQLPAPFYGIELFWLPAATYLILGTLWHFGWPLTLKHLFSSTRPVRA